LVISPKSIITTHLNADFDAVSSLFAAHFLHPGAVAVFPGSTEKNIQKFFNKRPDLFKIYTLKEIDLNTLEELIVVDTIIRNRIGEISKILDKPGIKITVYDHHDLSDNNNESNIIKGTVFRDKTGSNTTMMLGILLKESNKLQLTPEQATLLALGIYEDTGSFTFSSTTKKDLEMAGFLIEKGARPEEIRKYISYSWRPEHISLLNQLLETATIHKTTKGNDFVIARALTDKYVEEFATLSHQIMDLKDITTLFIMGQMGSNIIIVGRSKKGGLHVGEILGKIGGGGHPFSASATLKVGGMVEAEKILIDAVKKVTETYPKIADIMSHPPVTIEPEESIKNAHDKLSLYGFTVLPVVKEGEVIGLISSRTMEKTISHGFAEMPVRDFMTTDFEIAHPDDDFSRVQDIIISERQRFLPVVKDDRIIGVVTRTDLIHILTDKEYGENEVKPLFKDARYKNICYLIKEQISTELYALLKDAGETADKLNFNIYVVGGFVRDLILKKTNMDIDLVVEGNAIQFAKVFARKYNAKYYTHEKFITAGITFPDGFKIDVATARWEYYEYPAAMPVVSLSSIKLDLFRRDFTINTLAIRLNPKDFGLLLDFFGGFNDIKQKNIRVLHSLSFVDDPTRAYRAVRFENRFGFRITEQTVKMIRNAIRFGVFNKLSGIRLFNELKYILNEEEPLNIIIRCQQLGLLQIIYSDLSVSEKTENLFKKSKEVISWYNLLFKETKIEKWIVHLLVLLYNRKLPEIESIIERLDIKDKYGAYFIKDNLSVLNTIKEIVNKKTFLQSEIFLKLRNIQLEILLYLIIISDDETIQKAISFFISHTKDIKLEITGNDLLAMGIKQGPVYSKIFEELLLKKIDGEIKSRDDELDYGKKYYINKKVLS